MNGLFAGRTIFVAVSLEAYTDHWELSMLNEMLRCDAFGASYSVIY